MTQPSRTEQVTFSCVPLSWPIQVLQPMTAFLHLSGPLSIGQSVSHPLGLGPCPRKVFPGVWHFDFIAFWCSEYLWLWDVFHHQQPILRIWPPTSCPIILLGSDTNYLEFTSDSTSYRTQFHNTVLTLGVNHESWATCPSAWPAVSWGFPQLTHQIW